MALVRLSPEDVLNTEHIIFTHDIPDTETLSVRLSDGTVHILSGEQRTALLSVLEKEAPVPPPVVTPEPAPEPPAFRPAPEPEAEAESAHDEGSRGRGRSRS